MKHSIWSGIVAALLAAQPNANADAPRAKNFCKDGGERQSDGSAHYDSHHVRVIIHRGRNGPQFVQGLNPVDKPATINCKSLSGCLLTISPFVGVSGGAGNVCEMLDGAAIGGPYAFNFPIFETPVVTGRHSVQTQYYEQIGGSTLFEWQIIYTLYDK
ncbi:MAG: hypothetical protein JO208_12110 [Alphaproteobacteria bacterium]|nr:hypothetical protein [Alphaproteobacteria bacterium]